MSFLSLSTSSRIIGNQMRTQLAEITARHDESCSAMSNIKQMPPQNLSAKKHWFEDTIAKTLGENLLFMHWVGRALKSVAIMPCITEDSEATRRAVITSYSTNVRSNSTTSIPIIILTQHAMQRLMERKKDVRLLTLIKEEFDAAFLLEVLKSTEPVVCNPIIEPVNLKIDTVHGTAIVQIGLDGVIMKTWYTK